MTAWDQWLYDELPKLDLKGKKLAVFGAGDQMGYTFNVSLPCRPARPSVALVVPSGRRDRRRVLAGRAAALRSPVVACLR